MRFLNTPARLRGASPLALAIALGLALPGAAVADLVADAGADASHRERRASELEKVEVVGSRGSYQEKGSRTATRTDTPLIDTPQSITVIPQAVIRDQAMQGVGDSLRYVPGVGLAQGEGNRDTPIFRGNSSTADMFVDGLRDDVQYFRDLYNIDRVEVLKGPNAMAFGRGGTGGLLNRVTKLADWHDHRDLSLQVGSWNRYRATADLGGAISGNAAWRVNALAEESDSFRDGVEVSRRGINPVFALHLGEYTHLDLGVEHFEDERTADRGVSSWADRPLDVDPSTFFGDPDRSTSDATVDAFTAVLEHDFNESLSLRNSTRVAKYDKFYQNVFPGAVAGGGTTVAIQAYNNATERDNAFNQTDLVWNATTGSVLHTVLAGFEFGRQVTDNFRETGYFHDTTGCPAGPTSVVVPVADPRYTGPLCFAQSTTDADNHSVARTAAIYLQDQIELSPHWQLVLGLRHDRFEVDFRNNRTGGELESRDDLLSPRAGVVYKPRANVSLYANYSIAFLPRSGEQLASLSATTESLEPERFRNLEAGFKWDIRPDLSFTAAAYRLSRSNVAVFDQANPEANALVLLPGDSQRVDGIELGFSGRVTEHWSVIGGAAWQDAQITREIKTSATATPIPAGTVLPMVPRRSFSLWNRYDFNPRWGIGLGVVARSDVYTSTSNTVRLPGYARVDAAVFWKPLDDLRVQLNVENLLDREYFPTAHSNTNISPGSPRAFTLGLHYGF